MVRAQSTCRRGSRTANGVRLSAIRIEGRGANSHLIDSIATGLPLKRMVEPRGFEPLTPTMPLWCSTN
jgi:hypothetical protein